MSDVNSPLQALIEQDKKQRRRDAEYRVLKERHEKLQAGFDAIRNGSAESVQQRLGRVPNSLIELCHALRECGVEHWIETLTGDDPATLFVADLLRMAFLHDKHGIVSKLTELAASAPLKEASVLRVVDDLEHLFWPWYAKTPDGLRALELVTIDLPQAPVPPSWTSPASPGRPRRGIATPWPVSRR